ncbi:hypothetical protein BH10PSE9_BH10PSE9_20800 [soil metagenome]
MRHGVVALTLAAAIVIGPPAAGWVQPARAQTAVAVETDPTDLSKAFWTDWNTAKASPQISALAKGVGYADAKTAAIKSAAEKRVQAIVPIAITQPKDAAKLLDAAAESLADPVANKALATVAALRIAPKTRKAAIAYVAPASKKQVEIWNADLANGIRGLPGIYLSGSGQTSSGEVLSAPAGYAPVAGGSFGCPVR